MKNRVRIAGLSVSECSAIEEWQLFEASGEEPLQIEMTEAVETPDCSAFQIRAAHKELLVSANRQGMWLFSSPKEIRSPLVGTDGSYKRLWWHLPDEEAEEKKMVLSHLLRTALECRFCYEKTVSLHAACVEKDGYAVAFTGRSGLGKSTRAKMWVDALGAEWISGDRPAVRVEDAGSVACGAPWDGKEQICRNAERPLLAILEVRRSDSDYVRRLSEEQARKLLMRQSFVPMWDTDAAVMAMANVRALIRKTPVYRVFCGPGEDSAREIYDILYRHPENIREEAEEMQIKDGFVLRNVVDEYIVMPTGDNIAKFEGAVVLNDVSAFVFEQLRNPVSREDLLTAVLNEFEVDEATAAADLDVLLKQFAEMGLLNG